MATGADYEVIDVGSGEEITNPGTNDVMVAFHKSTGALEKIDYNKLAKAIIEQYTGSTIGGSAQSVKAAVDGVQKYATEKLSDVNAIMYRYGHNALLRIDTTFNQSSSYVEVGKFTNMSTFNNFYFSYVNPGNGNKAKLKYASDGTLSIMCPDGNTAIDASFPLLLL